MRTHLLTFALLLLIAVPNIAHSAEPAGATDPSAPAVTTAAQKPATALDDDQEIEDIEEVEDLAVVTSQTAQPASGSKYSLVEMIGHFHAALVHFPVAWTLLLFLVELWRRLFRRDLERSLMFLMWGLVAASFLPAAITGMIVASHGIYSQSAEALAEAMEHRNIMLGAMSVIFVAIGFGFSARSGTAKWRDWLYLGLLGLGFVILGFGAHHGGILVHGASYFPF